MTFQAPPIFAWLFFTPGVMFILVSFIRLQVDGITVLGAVFLILWAYLIGAFTRDFWVATIPTTHPDALGSLDLAERAHRQEQTNGTDIQR